MVETRVLISHAAGEGIRGINERVWYDFKTERPISDHYGDLTWTKRNQFSQPLPDTRNRQNYK